MQRSRLAGVLIAALTMVGLVAGSTPASSRTARIPAGAIPLGNGAYAMELKKATPDWYTSSLHERVVAAGKRGESVRLPRSANIPASALAFTGIRPGSWMLFPSWCTMNFVFGNASGNIPLQVEMTAQARRAAKRRATSRSGVYIGTAGHCASVGDEVTIVAAPGVLMNIGKTVKSVDSGIGNDFALVEIYPAMKQYVNPSMAIIAGPTGTKAPKLGDPILHVGHGLAIGTGGTARPGVVTYPNFPVLSDTFRQNKSDSDAYGWNGAVVNGDSGSGARAATGQAVGNVTHIVVWDKYLPATFAGTTISRMLQIAGKPLATASLVPDPLP
jgi:hypothetical protein